MQKWNDLISGSQTLKTIKYLVGISVTDKYTNHNQISDVDIHFIYCK